MKNGIHLVPCLVVRNEEYFISYVLAPLLRNFDIVNMIDTGSTDNTVTIAKQTANVLRGGRLNLIEADLKDQAIRIGDAKNHLMRVIKPHYMLLVDGDEIWPDAQLVAVKDYFYNTLEAKYEVSMVTGRNVFMGDDGKLFESLDGNMGADRIIRNDVRWIALEYPFEGHDLDGQVARGVVDNTPYWYWHTRHLIRSSKEQDAYFREKKRSYYKPKGERVPVPNKWYGPRVEHVKFRCPYDGSM